MKAELQQLVALQTLDTSIRRLERELESIPERRAEIENEFDRRASDIRALENRRGNAQLVLVGKGPMEEGLARHPVPGIHLAGLKHGLDLGQALRIGSGIGVGYAAIDAFDTACHLQVRIAHEHGAGRCADSNHSAGASLQSSR